MVIKRFKDLLGLVLCLVCLYLVYYIFDISCIIKYFTGISCPGCGMSRALLALINGDIKLSLYYHPLLLVLIGYFIIYLFKDYIDERIFKVITIILVILFIITYIYRLIYSDIVTIDIKSSLIYRIIFNA